MTKRLLKWAVGAVVCLVACVAMGQTPIPSTAYTRDLLRAPDAGTARATLGIVVTNVSIGQTNAITTNSPAGMTNVVLGILPTATGTNDGMVTSNSFNQFDTVCAPSYVPLVYSSWGVAGTAVDATTVTNMVSDMLTGNYALAGWNTVAIDEGWLTVAGRDGNGNLIGDPTKFPSGMSNLCAWVRSKGLHFGLYHGLGTNTESSGFKGSCGSSNTLGFIQRDAKAMASWGVDYVKLNGLLGVGTVERDNELHRVFIDAYKSINKNAYFWLLQAIGQPSPNPKWVEAYGEDFRVEGLGDGNNAPFSTMFANFDIAKTNVIHGHRPTMEGTDLFVINQAQSKTMAAFWAVLSMQGITDGIGHTNDVAYTNKEVMDCQQDWSHVAFLATNWAGNEVYAKKRSDNRTITALFVNHGPSTTNMTFDLRAAGLGKVVTVRDLFGYEGPGDIAYVTNGIFTTSVASSNANIYSFIPERRTLPQGVTYLSDLNTTATTTNMFIVSGGTGFDQGPYKKDKVANNDPLVLNSLTFGKGLGVIGTDYLEYFVGGADTFRALVGLSTAYSGLGGLTKAIFYLDGVQVFDTGLLEGLRGTFVDLDLRGHNKLQILCTNTESGGVPNSNDGITFFDPRFIKGSDAAFVEHVPVLSTFFEGSGVTSMANADSPSPTIYNGDHVQLSLGGSTMRTHKGLMMLPGNIRVVHRLKVISTNANTLAFSNTIYFNMRADVASTRQFSTPDTVKCVLTNGVNVLSFTNAYTSTNDVLRWLYMNWFATTTNTTSTIDIPDWTDTYE